MIEKYKSSWEYDCSSTPEAWTHNCYMLVNFVEGLKLKINELVDAVNSIIIVQEKLIDSRFAVETKREAPAENVQDDHYWFKQQERYRAALVLIRDLTGAGMSYHDIVVEMREIAKWALDPNYLPLLIGRYNKEASELLDVLREPKGGDNDEQ